MKRSLRIGLVAAVTLTAGAVFVTSVSADACEVPVTVTGLSPSEGFASGGTEVEITGTNFATCAIDRVAFGAADGTDLVVVDETNLTVVTPPGAGVVTPVLHFSTESISVGAEFTYVPLPEITDLRPPKGVATGGTPVLISGTGFAPAGSTTTVEFGDLVASPEEGFSAQRLQVMSPEPDDTGEVPVRVAVTLASGETGRSNAENFEYVPAPTITAIEPTSGPSEGGNVATITGTGFQRGVSVLIGPSDGSVDPPPGTSRFDGNGAARVVQLVDSETLRIVVPSGVPGVASVVATNPDGQYGVLTDGYTYEGDAPTITSVSPATGPSLGGTQVTITGTGFVAGAAVSFGNGENRAAATSIVEATPTQIVAVSPAHPPSPTPVAVRVQNPDGVTAVRPAAFTYNASPAPTLATLSPTTGTSLGGTALTITGSGFASGAFVVFGSGDDAVEAPAAVVDAGRLNVVTPPHPAGAAAVVVRNPDDAETTATATFTYVAAPAPTVTTVTPAVGPTRGGTEITITGSGFVDGLEVTVGGLPLRPVVTDVPPPDPTDPFPVEGTASQPLVRSATQIVGLTPNRAAGTVDVVVTNPDGASATLVGAFTYEGTPPPTIGSVTPETGSSLGGLEVAIVGTNFADGSIVTFGRAQCEGLDECRDVESPRVERQNATLITAVTPAGLFGFVNVTVEGPDGVSTTLPYGFDFGDGADPPVITDVTPGSGPTGTEITVSGTGFASETAANAASDARVEVGGQPLVDPSVPSAVEITGRVPLRRDGTVLVTVVNPDRQGVIVVDGYSYPVDTTAPETTATAIVGVSSHTFGPDSWARGPVTVRLASTDEVGGSGVKEITYSSTGAQVINPSTVPVARETGAVPSTPADMGDDASFVVSAQGRSTVSYWAEDIAGNVEDEQTAVVAIDSVGPTVTAASSFRPGSRTNQDVEVTFTCVDVGANGSGATSLAVTSATPITSTTTTSEGTPPTLSRSVTFTTAGLDQSVTATCTDTAGNTSGQMFRGVNITRDVVEVEARAHTADGLPYTSGTWTNRNVVVTYTCQLVADVRIKTLSPPTYFDDAITGGSATGTCLDDAGNSGSATFGGVRIDTTLPLMTATATTADGQPYVAGQWANGPVTVSFTCTDSGPNQSGVQQVSDPIVVSANGTTAGVSGTCTDVAGNRADPPVFLGPILIDQAPPACSVIVSPNPVGPANGRLVPVVATVRVTDALSGPTRFELVSVTSNRPASATSDIIGFTPGQASTTGSVRATRGNVYTFTYVGVDEAGNPSAPCARQLSVG